MIESRRIDPFTELVGPESPIWQEVPEGPDLLRAATDLFSGMHPYARRVMTQTPSGTYLSVDRRLHYQEAAYPTSSETPTADDADPYVYVFSRGTASDNARRMLPVQRTAGGVVMVSAAQMMRGPKGEVIGLLPQAMIAGEARGILRGLHGATPTTSEHAARLNWPEAQAEEALAFQGLVDTLLAAKGLEVSRLGATHQAVITPRSPFPRPWVLSGLIVGPSPAPQRCISDAQIASTATFDTSDTYSSAAVYDAHGRPLTVDLRYTRRSGKKWFMTPQERANARHALVNQLEPGNVDVRVKPLEL